MGRTIGLLLLALAIPADEARGQGDTRLIHTGFGFQNSFSTDSFLPLGRDQSQQSPADLHHAQLFTVPPGEDQYLYSLDLAVISMTEGSVLEVRVLGNDASRGLHGAPDDGYVLEVFHLNLETFTNVPSERESQAIVHLTSASGPLLRAGTHYWLELSIKSPLAYAKAKWWGAAPESNPYSSVQAQRRNLGSWAVTQVAGPGQAFRINLIAVPVHHTSGYKFSSIATTDGPFRRFETNGSLSLTNAGTVAFWAELDNGLQGIFTSDGQSHAAVTRGAEILADIEKFGYFPSMNTSGSVAFLGTPRDRHDGVLILDGKPLNHFADQTGPFHSLGHPSINAQGTVAFLAGLQGQGGGVFTLTSGTIATVAHTSGPFEGFYPRPSLNDKGTVVFTGRLDFGGSGVFAARRGGIATIADTATSLTSFGAPSINNRGTVAFWACQDAQQPSCPRHSDNLQGIFLGNGGPLTTLVDSRGPYRTLGNPVINNNRTVGFAALLDSGRHGIYTGPDPVTDKVIESGDHLLGVQVRDIGFSQGLDLNDAGEIAFVARLADGTEGIYLATPLSGQ